MAINPPIGLSYLYPITPILCSISIILLLTLIPGFWKTRVLVLIVLVGWLVLGNILIIIGTVGWHGNTHDAPIFADILVALWHIRSAGAFGSMAIFSKFVWQRLQPMSARQFEDNRRRNNLIDAFLTLILPVLYLPTFLFSCSGRYGITEDIGPVLSIWLDSSGFIISVLPQCLAATVMIVFNVLALFSYRRLKQQDHTSNPGFMKSTARTKKLLALSFVNLALSIFTVGWSMGLYLGVYPVSTWKKPSSIVENLQNLQYVWFYNRLAMESENVARGSNKISVSRLLSTPLVGFYLFAWFGFSAEARKSYGQVFASITGIKHTGTGNSTWARLVSKYWSHSEEKNLLPTKNPYLDSRLPAKPAKIYLSNYSDEVIDKKPDESGIILRHLSYHKSPLSPSSRDISPSEENGGHSPRLNEHDPPPRRLSHHKPPLPPYNRDTYPSQENSGHYPKPNEQELPSRRLSYHKPPLPPSSCDTPSSQENGGNCSRPNEHHLPQRRLSYHKPPLPSTIPVATPPASHENGLQHSKPEEISPNKRRLSYHKPPLYS